MKKNNKICVFLVVLFSVLFLLCTSSFASTDNTCNYDVSLLSYEEKNYIKECSNSVLEYCIENNISFEDYPYYFILSKPEGFSFSETDSEFVIVLADSNVSIYDSEWGLCLNDGYAYCFNFKVGDSSYIEKPSFINLRFAYASEYFTVYYTNFSNEYVTAEDSINFFPLALQGTLAPIVQETPLEGVLKEILEILPVILMTIAGLIGLRKALQFLSTVLHRS